jgi:RimJ/RimL family protein N-acetyltransferase
MAIAPIRTSRLLLRRWRKADREPFAALNADPEVQRYLGDPMTRGASDEYVDAIEAHWDLHGWGLWAVEVPDVAAMIGSIGLWPANIPGEPMVEVGWRLARDHWHRGYATEGAREALRVGFEDLGLHEIVSFTAAVNRPSISVMERLGMTRDAADDFDHPRVDPVAHPDLVPHVLYRWARERWRSRAEGDPLGN